MRKIPVVFPDEACVIKRAAYFAQTLRIEHCEKISGLPGGGDPHPFYSILISPIYGFFYGLTAFHIALIFNAFLVSLLVFPLYGIFKRFFNDNKVIFLGIFIVLFSAQLITFESMMMTETVYIVLNVWFIFFYIKSFEEHKWLYKGVAFLFAIFASLSRPFGFIVLLSMLVNESIRLTGKERRIILPLLLMATALFSSITFIYFNNDVFIFLLERIKSVNSFSSLKNVLLALVEQINSFSLALFIAPLIIFFSHIGKRDSDALNAIRWYLLAYLLFNFAISAQHIYGYLLVGDDPGFLTRYINSSLIYILIFAFAFFQRYSVAKLFGWNALITACIIAFLLFMPEGFKHSLSPDLSIYGNIWQHLYGKDLIPVNSFLKYFFLPFSLLLFALLTFNKKMAFSLLFLCLMAFNSTYLVVNLVPQGFVPPFVPLLQDLQANIAVVVTYERDQDAANYFDDLWVISSLSRNKFEYITFDVTDPAMQDPKKALEKLRGADFFERTPYVISRFKLDLPLIASWSGDSVLLYANPFAKNGS